MAVLAKAFVAMAAFFAVAVATNNANTTTATTTTTETTFTTSATTATTTTATIDTSATGANMTSTATATTTATTTTAATTETVTSTITYPQGTQTQEQVEGEIGITITGDCAAFCSDPVVITSWQETVASVAGSGIDANNVDVTLTHTCNRRLEGLSMRKGSLGAGRRLSGAVKVAYRITIPSGAGVAANTVTAAITSQSTGDWDAEVASKLVAAGVSASTYAVTVQSVQAPTINVVTITTTGTSTTATVTLPGAGIDSSAFLRKAFSSAHLWGLIALFAANHFFA